MKKKKMVITEGKILNWGNSIGIRLSKSALNGSELGVNDKVSVKIEKKYTTVGDIFGKRKSGINTQKALDEIDEMFGEW